MQEKKYEKVSMSVLMSYRIKELWPTSRSSRPEGLVQLSNVFSFAYVPWVSMVFGRPLPAALLFVRIEWERKDRYELSTYENIGNL